MTGRLSLSLAALAVGLGVLVASVLARPAGSASAAGQARKGGTLRMRGEVSEGGGGGEGGGGEGGGKKKKKKKACPP